MRIIIVGTGGMARNHAVNFAAIPGVAVVAGVDVDQARAEAFAAKYNIPRAFGSLDAAIAWGEFDAAANVTPDKAHHPTTLKLLAAGKHVFCEKPLAEDYPKAKEMADTAEKAGLVAMVNLSYRNVAQLQKARAMVLAGEIGTVRHIEASYLQSWLVSKAWGDWQTEPQWLWRLSKAHGSNGCLGDTGIHILDFAVYGAASDVENVFCRMKAFDKAKDNRIGDYTLDANDGFTMSVTFANGALGVIHGSRWATGHLNDLSLRIYGSKGALEVIHTTKGSSLRSCVGDGVERADWQDVEVEPVDSNYQRFVAAVRAGKTVEPSFRHAANLQKVLDAAVVSDQRHAELDMTRERS
jgi:predicted dehydrogenase